MCSEAAQRAESPQLSSPQAVILEAAASSQQHRNVRSPGLDQALRGWFVSRPHSDPCKDAGAGSVRD